MAGERKYTRIPPASTGDRITHEPHALLPYENLTGQFILDSFVSLAISGITAHVHSVFPQTATTGFLGVHYDVASTFANLTPTAGENINYGGSTIATVSSTVSAIDLFTANNVIVGKNNPDYGMQVDQFGAATVRFTEGAAQLDAFGKLRTAGASLLGEYVFASSYLPQAFSNTISGSGAISWDGDERAAVLTTSGDQHDLITHTANTYHHYIPGTSHFYIGTLAHGDSGKAGHVRNWGLFDSRNGFLFTTRGTELGVVIRSSATGTRTETIIYQSDWNQDTADGSGGSSNPSGMNLDITKDNIYWIDVQWLGAGRVRYGTYYNGTRVTLHEHYHGNTSPYPLTQTASLPVCISMANTGSVGSSSQIKSWCQAVYAETDIDVTTLGSPETHTITTTITGSFGTDEYYYMGTMSPEPTLSNGEPNRSLYFPVNTDILAYDSTGAEALVEVEIYAEPIASGFNFEPTQFGSTVDVDVSASFYGGGKSISRQYVRGNQFIDTSTNFNNLTYGSIKNYSEDGGTRFCGLSNITNAATASVTLNTSNHAQWLHREFEPATVSGVTGMTEINGQEVYLKATSRTTGELYTDAALTSGLDTTGYGSYTGGGLMTGAFGARFLFVIVAKKLIPNSNDITIHWTIDWKEITQ